MAGADGSEGVAGAIGDDSGVVPVLGGDEGGVVGAAGEDVGMLGVEGALGAAGADGAAGVAGVAMELCLVYRNRAVSVHRDGQTFVGIKNCLQ